MLTDLLQEVSYFQFIKTKLNVMDAGKVHQLSTTEILALVSAPTSVAAIRSCITGLDTLSVAVNAINKYWFPAMLLPAIGARRPATVSATRNGVPRDTSKTDLPVLVSVNLKTVLMELLGTKKSVLATRILSVRKLSLATLLRPGT